ncbi:MAG: hypothetical protein MH132_12285 [Hydrotalea sp.]|nr:hypothetical protein [Hydrotalea sp.]
MVKKIVEVLLLIVFVTQIQAQTYFDFTEKYYRDSTKNYLIQLADATIGLSLNRDNHAQLASAFWAMEIMQYRPAHALSAIRYQLPLLTKQPAFYQRAFLQMLHSLYPKQYSKEILSIWKELDGTKNQAMALEYLAMSGLFPEDFKLTENDSSHIYYYAERIKRNIQPILADALLDTAFFPNQLLVVSLQHNDRNIPGTIRFRLPNHTWHKRTDGTIWEAPQLARAITNLPFYLTNGNTPQGLYVLDGFAVSENDWIGPTTNLQMRMPFETNRIHFFAGDSTKNWEEGYKSLLGPFKNKTQLWESFIAGKLGRTEIIAHGTTIDPTWYKNQPYFPNTPSLGCLCSPEFWNEKGIRTKSSQEEWIQVLQSLGGGQQGYLLVVDVQK